MRMKKIRQSLKLYSVRELSELLDIKEDTLYSFNKYGRLPKPTHSFFESKRLYYNDDDVKLIAESLGLTLED